MKIEFQWKWFDLWIGIFIDINHNCLYICPLPTFVIKIKFNSKIKNSSDPLYTVVSMLHKKYSGLGNTSIYVSEKMYIDYICTLESYITKFNYGNQTFLVHQATGYYFGLPVVIDNEIPDNLVLLRGDIEATIEMVT